MDKPNNTQRLILERDDTHRLADLCGRLNEHIRQIEQYLSVTIQHRGNNFLVSGNADSVQGCCQLLRSLYQQTEDGSAFTPYSIFLTLKDQADCIQTGKGEESESKNTILLNTPRCSVKPRGAHQLQYVKSIRKYDINFGIGPAGTGKTYLAVACAVEALTQEKVNRLLLVRPAVEAGEKLGFLPGDLAQKVDPYLRPLYDALFEMLGFEKVTRLMEKNVIEVAPLAYMRGRTLNNSFIILDESQNTTASQMKMFLTRIGFGSTAVITGDVTQIDLPRGTRSGLVHVCNILEDVEGIGFCYFDSRDVVRHTLVQRIVEAYDVDDQKNIATLNSQESSQVHERDS